MLYLSLLVCFLATVCPKAVARTVPTVQYPADSLCKQIGHHVQYAGLTMRYALTLKLVCKYEPVPSRHGSPKDPTILLLDHLKDSSHLRILDDTAQTHIMSVSDPPAKAVPFTIRHCMLEFFHSHDVTAAHLFSKSGPFCK